MPASESKITPELRARADSDAGDLVDVVVELYGANGGATSVPQMKSAFSHAAVPVSEAIAGLGGEVTAEAWINQTLRARVPAHGLAQLADLEHVSALDVPHRIEPE